MVDQSPPPVADETYSSKQRSLIGVDVALIVLSGTAVGLRLLARKVSKADFWWDDYTIVVAMILSWAMPILNIIAEHYDFGKHESVARPDAAEKWFYILYIFQNFYTPAIALAKASILLFYARIFAMHPLFKKTLYVMALIVFLWWIICQGVSIFPCLPIHYFWDRMPVTGHCIDVQPFFLGQSIPNIVTDVALMAIPVPLIWKLQLPNAQKWALMGIFMLGSLVTIASMYRLASLFSNSKLTEIDVTWDYVTAAILSAVEPNIAVVSACLPMLRPLLKYVTNKFNINILRTLSRRKGLPTSQSIKSQQLWSREQNGPPNSQFAKIPDFGPERDGQEEWEMWDGAKRIETRHMASGEEGMNMLKQAEMGVMPAHKIYVKREISQTDNKGPR